MAIPSHLPTSKGTTKQGTIEECKVVVKISDMQAFTIHFRRPDTKLFRADEVKASTVYYDGSYGFDWLRDEYVYDIEEVHELGKDPLTNDIKIARLYKGDVANLCKEYTRLSPIDEDIADISRIRTLLGEPYIPAWLAIFPTSHSSGNNSAGVDLYLQVEQEQALGKIICPLTDPASIAISFDTGDDSGITVTTGISTLADLIGVAGPELKRHFNGSEMQSKVVKRYKDTSKKINIKATTGSNKVRVVKVIAKTKKFTRTVGLLCVYPNGTVKQSDIKAVPCVISPRIAPIMPLPSSLQQYINRSFLNQSITQSTIQIEQTFDPNTLMNPPFNLSQNRMKSFGNNLQAFVSTNSRKAPYIHSKHAGAFRDVYVKLYEDAYNMKLNDDDDERKTYIFFTDYGVYTENIVQNTTYPIYGAASNKTNLSCSTCTAEKITWGNTIVMFNQGNINLNTISHELGHSFGLAHSFADSHSTPHSFYQGYTDNLMDYPKRINTALENPYKGNMISLFKWQWTIIRQDRSMK